MRRVRRSIFGSKNHASISSCNLCFWCTGGVALRDPCVYVRLSSVCTVWQWLYLGDTCVSVCLSSGCTVWQWLHWGYLCVCVLVFGVYSVAVGGYLCVCALVFGVYSVAVAESEIPGGLCACPRGVRHNSDWFGGIPVCLCACVFSLRCTVWQ